MYSVILRSFTSRTWWLVCRSGRLFRLSRRWLIINFRLNMAKFVVFVCCGYRCTFYWDCLWLLVIGLSFKINIRSIVSIGVSSCLWSIFLIYFMFFNIMLMLSVVRTLLRLSPFLFSVGIYLLGFKLMFGGSCFWWYWFISFSVYIFRWAS